MNERMDEKLMGLIAFTKVAELGSFSAAAKALSLPLATVSRRVAKLESQIGLRLLHRTTRRMSLTDIGKRYLQHGRRIMEDLAASDAELASAKAAPEGILRITAPVLFGRYCVAPILRDFLIRYPAVRASLHLSDRIADPVAEQFDLAVRGGELPDSSLIARRIGQIVSGIYAAPGRKAELGERPSLDSLIKQPMIDVICNGLQARIWSLGDGSRERFRSLSVRPRHEVDDAETAADLAEAGLGICPLPLFIGEPRVAKGTLVRIRPDLTAGTVPVSLLHPPSRFIVPAVKIMSEMLAKALRA